MAEPSKTMDGAMATVAENLSENIYQTGTLVNPWLSQVKEEPWEDGRGYTQDTITLPEATLPNGATWIKLDESTACSVKGDVLEVGYIKHTYGLEKMTLNSSKICLVHGRTKFQVMKQTENVTRRLGEVFNESKAEKTRASYVGICKNKVILSPGFPGLDPAEGESKFAEIAPVSVLTEGALEKFAAYLDAVGAGEFAGGRANGAPAYMLFTSPETSRSIMRLNPDNRDDYRNDPGSLTALLASIGVNKTHNRFAHVVDRTAPRYAFKASNAEGQKWVPIPRLIQADGANGTKIAIPNPDYMTAEFEDSIIFVPEVMARVIQADIKSLGAGSSFPLSSVNGQFRWVNIQSEQDNIDGNTGFFRSTYVAGARPIDPRLGVTIRHRRYADPGVFVDQNGKPIVS